MFGATRGGSAARLVVTLGLSAAGGLAATAVGLPAGWIAGGLLTVALASLAGLDTDVPLPLRAPVYLVLGVYAGSGVSQETLHQMQTWPASFAILGLSLVVLIAGCYWWLHKSCGWDRNAALLASLPGALSFVLAAAESLQLDMKKVAIAQSLRLLVLVELIPLVALLIGMSPAGVPTMRPPTTGPVDLLILLATGAAASLVLSRLQAPGAWLLGGLLASAALSLTGLVEARLPHILVVLCTVALGAIAGSRFRPGDWAVLPRIAGPALVAVAIAIIVSGIGALAVTLLLGVNFIQALLAFAPGALETLIILATEMEVDPAYVAAHHVARLLVLVAAVPLLAHWLNRHP